MLNKLPHCCQPVPANVSIHGMMEEQCRHFIASCSPQNKNVCIYDVTDFVIL